MPRFVSILLVVITLGSVTGLAWMLARPNPDGPRVAALEADLRGAQKEIARLREQLAQRPGASANVPSLAVPATGPATAATPDVAASSTRPPGQTANIREMLATPGMRAMMEQQQATQIDMGYGRLFELLQLTPEEKANFRQALLEREKTQTDFALKMMDPNLTPEERKKLAAEMQVRRDIYEKNFKTFLNDAKDFATFKDWEETQPERLQFDMIGRNLFAQGGEPLSAEQEQQLITTASKVRKSSPAAATNPANPGNMDPSKMTDAVIQNYAQQLKQNDDQVVAEAASFLTPTQIKTLQTYQEQARNMAVAGIKMSATLTGGLGGK